MIVVWVFIVKTLRLSARGVARSILANLSQVKPLTKEEAERIELALKESGVPDATTRFSAGFTRIVLKQVTQ